MQFMYKIQDFAGIRKLLDEQASKLNEIARIHSPSMLLMDCTIPEVFCVPFARRGVRIRVVRTEFPYVKRKSKLRLVISDAEARLSKAACKCEIFLGPGDLLLNGESFNCLGFCIDFERKSQAENSLLYKTLPGYRTVFCSLGTMASEYAWASLFLKKVIEAAREFPSVRLIMQANKEVLDFDVPHSCNNVEIYHFVDQLSVIKGSELVITHGGFGTVKECLWYRKPILVAPFAFDQFENARRITTLGFGNCIDNHASKQKISEAIDFMLENQELGSGTHVVRTNLDEVALRRHLLL